MCERQRRRMSEAEVTKLASRLTDRDRRIAFDCFEHRVLTTEQLRRLHFHGNRTTRARLGQLYLWQVLDRFRNPFVEHKLADIAVHHANKVQVRLVPTRDEYVAKFGRQPPLLSEVLAMPSPA